MLTKEHLRLHRRADRALPVFADTANPDLLAAAESVLAIFRNGATHKIPRGELSEQLTGVTASRDEAAAFVKLAEGLCTFADCAELDYPAMRAELFSVSGFALQNAASPEELREKLAGNARFSVFLQQDIYGDLPENQQLVSFRDLSAQELLERYNVAQVQGLLIYARKLQIRTDNADPAELRRLFKYLKFFRLLSEIRQKGQTSYLTISGPLEIFANTRKYALQLAAFFPAVLLLKSWKLNAEIEWKNRTLQLNLDEKSNLRSHYRNFSAYVPEEIAMFHRLFREKIKDWTIVGETPVLSGNQGEVFFPDLSFREETSRKVVHLELFHRWHKHQLESRLIYLAQHRQIPLLLGIDRSIADENALTEYLTEYPQLMGRLFLFRDFPGVDRVAKLLREM